MIFVSVSVFFSKLGVCRVPRGFGALGFGHVPGRRRRTRPRSATPCVARGPASPPDFFGMGSTVRLGTQPIPVIFWGWYFGRGWWVASMNFWIIFGFLDGSVSVRRISEEISGVRLFQERLLSEKTFDLAFIMLGTNDLASGEDIKQFILLQSNLSGRSPATDHTVSLKGYRKVTYQFLSGIFTMILPSSCVYHDFTMNLPWFYLSQLGALRCFMLFQRWLPTVRTGGWGDLQRHQEDPRGTADGNLKMLKVVAEFLVF